MSFTPGPWRVDWADEGGPCESVNDIVAPDGRHVVCFGHDYDDYGYISNNDDARLIAAAPELLDALKVLTAAVIRDDNPRDEGHFSESEEMKAAHAAIAKAEGRL